MFRLALPVYHPGCKSKDPVQFGYALLYIVYSPHTTEQYLYLHSRPTSH